MRPERSTSPSGGRHGLRAGGGAVRHRAGDAGAAQPAIAPGVLGQVLLVVVLGVVEGAGRQDLRGDRPVTLGGERPATSLAEALHELQVSHGLKMAAVVSADGLIGAFHIVQRRAG